MSRVDLIGGGAAFGEGVGQALHPLAGLAEATGDVGDAGRLSVDRLKHEPAGKRLAPLSGDRLPGRGETVVERKDPHHEVREGSTRLSIIDNMLSIG